MQAYKNADPPTKNQKAITPKFLLQLYEYFVNDEGRNRGDTMNAHFVDLYLGMFFFACRCCEYCETKGDKRTKRLTMGDVSFRDSQKLVMEVDNEDDLNRAQYVSLRFRDQKNGDKEDTRTQGRTGKRELDPVTRIGWAILRLKRRVNDWGHNTELCTIGEVSNRLRITDTIALEIVRDVCRLRGGKEVFGFDAWEIGNKSLRSGAAMALALGPNNHNEMKIKILGRWRSTAFMAYIRPQILELTSNLAEDMVSGSGTDTSAQTHDMRLNY